MVWIYGRGAAGSSTTWVAACASAWAMTTFCWLPHESSMSPCNAIDRVDVEALYPCLSNRAHFAHLHDRTLVEIGARKLA